MFSLPPFTYKYKYVILVRFGLPFVHTIRFTATAEPAC